MKNPILLAIVALLISLSTYAQQDYQFTQFWNAPLMLNPALTGDLEQGDLFRISSSHSYGKETPFYRHTKLVHQLSLDMGIPVFKRDVVGIGVEGIFNYNLRANEYYEHDNATSKLSLAYIKAIGPTENAHYISIAANVYYENRNVGDILGDWRIIPVMAPWPSSPNEYLDYYHRLDVDLGANWHFGAKSQPKNRYDIGFSVGHLNQSTHPFAIPEGITGVFPKLRYSLQASTLTAVDKRWMFGGRLIVNKQATFVNSTAMSRALFNLSSTGKKIELEANFGLNMTGIAEGTYLSLKPRYLVSSLALNLKRVSISVGHRYYLSPLSAVHPINNHSIELGLQYRQPTKLKKGLE